MIIRAYNNDTDLNEILFLLEELRGSTDSNKFSFYLKDSGTYKDSYLKSKNYFVLIAKTEDKIAGYIIAEHYTNFTVNLVMLYVGQFFRRKGVAQRLKDEMVKLCRLRGYRTIVSQVRTNNYESISLNQKAGWKQSLDKIYPDYYYWFTKEL